jgi:RHS repeat-associated protein
MQFDSMGRLGGMTQTIYICCNQNGDTYPTDANFAQASYGMAGQLTNLAYDMGAQGPGSQMTENRSYNNMFQLTGITVQNYQTSVYQPPQTITLMNDVYNYKAGQNNGRITSSQDLMIGETVHYGYEPLNRLSSASATNGAWGQSFGYDGFGNLTAKTATAGSVPTLSVSFDAATNHQVGVGYDANGNTDGNGTTVYDVENRMIQHAVANGDSYSYDHAGKRVVKRYYPATFELYFYDISGRKLETKTCTSNTSCQNGAFNTYFGGKLVKSKGVTVAVDRLGSVRGTYDSVTLTTMRYYPYGEERTSTGDGREKFGMYMRDNPGQDYADQRYYGVGTGRFNVPDPGGIRTASPASSLTWNRYSYTHGDPINFGDRFGLDEMAVAETAQDCINDPTLKGCHAPCSPVESLVEQSQDPDCYNGDGGGGGTGGGGDYEPTSGLECHMSGGNTSLPTYRLNGKGITVLNIEADWQFTATGGGSGPYLWDDVQTKNGSVLATYSNGTVDNNSYPPGSPDGILPNRSPATNSTITFRDAPGQHVFDGGGPNRGILESLSFNMVYDLDVTVRQGTSTAHCHLQWGVNITLNDGVITGAAWFNH